MKPRFFAIAKAMSIHSDHHTHKIGTAIIKKNRVISTGYNKLKTHPSAKNPFSMTHAELDCILGVSKEDLLGSDIYVFRQQSNGNIACSKPCKHCQQLILSAGIKNVFYTDNGKFCKL